MDENRVLVAIPVFNEIDVYDIIQKIKNLSLDIVVIDDGSSDEFRENLMHIEDIHMIIHARNLGYGKTIIDAFTFAINKGYDYVVTIDGDGQHEPEQIPLFLKEIPFYNYDILSGSRYFIPTKIGKEVPKDRYLINKEITKILNCITRFHITDAFCGFKAYKVKKLKVMHLTEYGYGMPLQLWIQAWKLGLRVKEIPVKLIYKDPKRNFKGILEDPNTRLRYYKDIIKKELACLQQHNAATRRGRQRVRF